MTNKKFLMGILIVALAFGMTIAGCDNGSTGHGGSLAYIGDMFSIYEKVYIEVYDSETSIITYKPYEGPDITIEAPYTGVYYNYYDSSNGYFNIGTFVTPPVLSNIDELTAGLSWTITISDPSAQGFLIDYFRVTIKDDSSDYYLQKTSYNFDSYPLTNERIVYVYTDRDVILTGIGSEDTSTYPDPDTEITYIITDVYRDFSIPLKAGWNALHSKTKTTGNLTSETSTTINNTTTLSGGDSNKVKWVLIGGSY